MIVFYVVCKMALMLAHAILTLRASRIERKYVKTSCKVQEELKLSDTRPGNAMGDARLNYARKQYELGRMVQKCERIGDRYVKAQALADRVGMNRTWIDSYQGRFTPYLLGVVDMVVLTALLNHYGFTLLEAMAQSSAYVQKM